MHFLALGTSSKICPRNVRMTDDARLTILDWHNSLRGSLAKGKEEDGEGGAAPMGANVLKMVRECGELRGCSLTFLCSLTDSLVYPTKPASIIIRGIRKTTKPMYRTHA